MKNVVIIYADDLGWGDVGCNQDLEPGAPSPTPYLDALAADGVRCTQWYSNSPVCSPSRAALLSGRHPDATGVSEILAGRRHSSGLPTTVRTIARILGEAGFATGLFGKWHLGTAPETSPNAHGFDEFFGFRAGCVDYFSHIHYWDRGTDPVHDLWADDTEVWRNGEYVTEVITERAVDFIRRAARADRPFLAYVPYSAPHYPMHAPQRYLDRFPQLPPDRRIMAAMVAAMDDGIGEILAALDEGAVREDTVIVFSSDNGPSSESRNWLDGTPDPYYGGSTGGFRGHKGSLFDGGIREPTIIAAPGALPAGTASHTPAQMIDVLPTVLDLLGIDRGSETLDGRSRLARLRGAGGADETPLFWRYGDQAAVRRGSWKLVTHGRDDLDGSVVEDPFLADLASDPGERVNRAAERPELVKELVRELEAWLAATADAAPGG
ncbi:hypothetical protein GCM10023322_30290 [Rugosimonospora acidiphila]|uniref:Sulfatase N-terminal domain-containing protein n=1 Tax=Rugosimonospora acidiphila TaxID=556531 RepID=A0ABP9RRI3_9ACTN